MVFCSISLPPLINFGTTNKHDLRLGLMFVLISAAGILHLFLYVNSKEFFYFFLTCMIPKKQKLRHTEKVNSKPQAEKTSKFLICFVCSIHFVALANFIWYLVF